jgi:RNA polymerase sigma-70 factor (ECF subfamily)
MPPDNMATSRTEIIPTRVSLIQRLRDWNDTTSWKDFFDTYWKLIYGVARKTGLSDAEAQDVVQETIITVARKMPEFSYDPAIGRFKSWLMQVTRSRIVDQIRRKQYEEAGKRLPREMPLSEAMLEQHAAQPDFDLEAVWNEEWEHHVLEAAMKKVKQNADAKQFQMFQLHVIKSVPAREVAKKLRVKLAEVYFAKYKIGAQVRKEIKALERRML